MSPSEIVDILEYCIRHSQPCDAVLRKTFENRIGGKMRNAWFSGIAGPFRTVKASNGDAWLEVEEKVRSPRLLDAHFLGIMKRAVHSKKEENATRTRECDGFLPSYKNAVLKLSSGTLKDFQLQYEAECKMEEIKIQLPEEEVIIIMSKMKKLSQLINNKDHESLETLSTATKDLQYKLEYAYKQVIIILSKMDNLRQLIDNQDHESLHTLREATEDLQQFLEAVYEQLDPEYEIDLLRNGLPEEMSNWPALMIAAWFDLSDLVPALIRRGADVNAMNQTGQRPLHYAASADIANILLCNKASINAADNMERTPLHIAAYRGKDLVLKLFLDDFSDQLDLNAKDCVYNTPLHLACKGLHADAAKLLIDAGASAETLNKEKKTPIEMATPEFMPYLKKVVQEAAVRRGAEYVRLPERGSWEILIAMGKSLLKLIKKF